MNGRLRARFTKTGKIRFTSHRDVARIWERALRRAGLAIAYTEGFSPRPKLSFGLALSTGYESLGEYLDINLINGAPVADGDGIEGIAGADGVPLPSLLDPALPVGMDVQAVVPLPVRSMSLQQAVTSCTWHIRLPETVDPGVVRSAVDRVLTAPELIVTRERKGTKAAEDLRPGILHVQVLEPALRSQSPEMPAVASARDGAVLLEAELATQPRAVRPAELVGALVPGVDAERVVRIHQWTQAGGARQEVIPLPSAATPARTREARAS